MNPQTDRAAAIVEQYGCKTENLIAILQDIQAAYNYLSEANLTLVADRLGISVSKVYSVATFYENFSLEAKGRHIIKVCAGTACHVRKSGPIYDAIYEYLCLSGKRRTSDDGMFTWNRPSICRSLITGAASILKRSCWQPIISKPILTGITPETRPGWHGSCCIWPRRKAGWF